MVERLRAAALTKAMAEFPDRTARPVLVRKNMDKLSFAFLLAKPGPHSGILSVHFSEQLLTLLAVSTVMCRL